MDSNEHADSLVALLPAGADAARLIVCERSGRWAAALRREMGGAVAMLQEARSLPGAWDLLDGSPASFVLVELTRAGAADLLRRMARLQRDYPLARVAIVADRRLGSYEWLMREAGAVHFTCSPRQLGPMYRLACRHLAQSPPPRRSAAQRILASLPWQTPGGNRADGSEAGRQSSS